MSDSKYIFRNRIPGTIEINNKNLFKNWFLIFEIKIVANKGKTKNNGDIKRDHLVNTWPK